MVCAIRCVPKLKTLFIKSSTYKRKEVALLNTKTDESLVHYYKACKDQVVIAILFERYVHLVFASSMKYLKNEEEARDVSMEIFESLHDKLLRYEISTFSSWLFVITKNACLMHLRKNKNNKIEFNTEKISDIFVDDDCALHLTRIEQDEEVLMQMLQKLNEGQKICVEYMYLKDKSYKEIADETGYELTKVKSYIQNGKRNLKMMLEQHYESQK